MKERKREPDGEYFRRNVAINTLDDPGCWEWQGYIASHGYGQACRHYRTMNAHRFVYELLIGPIPRGLHLDHLCRNTRCVNPSHLEPVTPKENIHRSPIAPTAVNARKTHCPKGHPYDEQNTYRHGHGRSCRICMRESCRRRYRQRPHPRYDRITPEQKAKVFELFAAGMKRNAIARSLGITFNSVKRILATDFRALAAPKAENHLKEVLPQ